MPWGSTLRRAERDERSEDVTDGFYRVAAGFPGKKKGHERSWPFGFSPASSGLDAAYSGKLALLEAFPAEHGPSLGRTKRHCGFFTAR